MPCTRPHQSTNTPASITANLPAANSPYSLTSEEEERITNALNRALAPATLSYYRRRWGIFVRWCEERGVDPVLSTPELIAAFLTELVKDGARKATTLTAYTSALRYHFTLFGHDPNPMDAMGVKRVMQGIRRELGIGAKQAPGLTATQFAEVKVFAYVPRYNNKYRNGKETPEQTDKRAKEDIAVISVMRDGMLRAGETLALTWGDVSGPNDDGSGSVYIKQSKTDQLAEGAYVYLSQGSFRALMAIRPVDVDNDQRIFPWHYETLKTRISNACKVAGLPGNYTTHSLRVGMAQDLTAAGISLPAIQQAGRWGTPDMPARYARKLAVKDGGVAQYYARQGG